MIHYNLSLDISDTGYIVMIMPSHAIVVDNDKNYQIGFTPDQARQLAKMLELYANKVALTKLN